MKARPSSFGFGVVVHPKDPDTAWFVPGIKDEKRYPVDGKLVVTRTRDGGKTFDVLSKGRAICGFGLCRVPRGASRRPEARLGDVRAGHKENATQRRHEPAGADTGI